MTCVPPAAARDSIQLPATVPPAAVLVRLNVAAGGPTTVLVKYDPETTTVRHLLQALHVVVPGGVSGRVLVSSYPRREVCSGSLLEQSSGGDSLLTSAGVGARSVLLLRREGDA